MKKAKYENPVAVIISLALDSDIMVLSPGGAETGGSEWGPVMPMDPPPSVDMEKLK